MPTPAVSMQGNWLLLAGNADYRKIWQEWLKVYAQQ
jgi:hypothetical protein